MSRTKKTLLAVLVLAFAIASAGHAGWAHFTNTVRTPDGNLAHTTQLIHTVVLGTALENSQACVDYARDTEKPGQGRLLATALFELPDGSTSEIDFTGGIAKNEFFTCKKAPDAPIGTIAQFTYEFRGMPRIFGNKGQYSDIRSVVSNGKPEIELLGLTPADEGRGRILSTSSLFAAEKASQKHPTALVHTLITNRLLLAPSACVSYSREAAKKPNKGRVVSSMNVIYPDGETESLKFAGGVRKGEFVRCKELSRDAPAGTMVESDISFLGMPKLSLVKTQAEYFDANSSLSSAGSIAYRQPPAAADPPKDDDDGGGGTPPPPPPGSGGLTGADQLCISRLMMAPGGGSRQIVRPRGNRGGRFEVFGPRSQAPGGVINQNTVGHGNTYDAACKDYERKMGPIGPPGPPLTARDIGNWVWYGTINSSGGPTAIRRDPRGGFHGDYWRPATGTVIISGPSPSAVIETLRTRHKL